MTRRAKVGGGALASMPVMTRSSAMVLAIWTIFPSDKP
jgi:hypothetical protein